MNVAPTIFVLQGGLPARQAQDGYGSSGVGIGGNAIHDASIQVGLSGFPMANQ